MRLGPIAGKKLAPQYGRESSVGASVFLPCVRAVNVRYTILDNI